MKAYIEVADETQKIQMDKWNTHQYKSQIIELLDKASERQLKDMLGHMNGVMLKWIYHVKEYCYNDYAPFIIADELKMFYYRGHQQWPGIKGLLMYTSLTAQDQFKVVMRKYQNSRFKL